MGKLIVIEGIDGSGKATQSKLLFKALKDAGEKVRLISFPDYNSPASEPVKMYLGGAFGTDPNAVNPYAASSFYAVDRFASFLKDWKAFYEESDKNVVICDRYVTSNMIYQAAKFNTTEEKTAFWDWEYDFEYNKRGLPVPDLVLFLDVDLKASLKLMENRENKITHTASKDIHESNKDFLKESSINGRMLARKYRWTVIPCCDEEGKLKPIEEIHDLVLQCVISCLKMWENFEQDGYHRLWQAVQNDCLEHGGVLHPEGCCDCGKGCSHRYCDKFRWAVDRAKEYEEATCIDWKDILTDWENNRTYWYMNYYQECNQPAIDSKKVRIFDTEADFWKSVGNSGYRCPSCGKISKDPYECKACGWKVYGLLKDLGKGVFVLIKDSLKGDTIFMPVAWEGGKNESETKV